MPTATKRGDRREIAASVLGMDYREIGEYHYQPSRFRPALYAVGEQYLFVGTDAERAAIERKLGYVFARHRDAYWQSRAQAHGWTVWTADTESQEFTAPVEARG